MNDRRAEPRLLCSDLIPVRLELDEPVELIANLEDISPSGACIQFEDRVPAGTRISLKLGRHRFRGTVMYCAEHETGYFAGVRFDAGRKWSIEVYKPRHLLDPMTLGVRRSKPTV